MNSTFSKSDIKILLLFYAIGIPVTIMDGWHNGWVEMLLDTTIYVVFSFTALWVIVFKIFPSFLTDRSMLKATLLTTLFLIFIGFIEIHCYHYTGYFSEEGISDWSKHSWGDLLLWGFFTSIENAGILLGVFLGKKFYDAQVDIQAREKEKREAELRLLKSQIDPHFLFNNLNTVDALIDADPSRAKSYLHKLSKLYRYLIATKDDEVVPLIEELEFAENYIYLLEQRFGDAYQFEISNPSNQKEVMIPPGALQVILENVIKHNEGSVANPILTKIDISETEVLVSNNIKPKLNPVDSTGAGLENLIARYELLTDKPIRINQSSSYDIVIPLLNQI